MIKWRDEKIIKVVTGIRRCGKSTLLSLFADYLKEGGVSDSQIVFVNFEDLETEELQDYKKLYQYLKERILPMQTTYIFLDEIQMVGNFEKVVDSLYLKENVDMYITGSNAYLLSGELSTLLSGRYVSINMLPFSFAEFYEIRKRGNPEESFSEYIKIGSFPYVASLPDAEEKASAYLEGVYNTIIVKDIEDREKRRRPDPNSRKITDITLLQNIARFLAASVGNQISIKSVADYITSSGRRVSQNTVADYIRALVEPYVFYPVERFDISGKMLLKTNQKIYISDLGLRNYLVPKRGHDLGFVTENIVYLELKRRGFNVNIGKMGNSEVDFVAEKRGRYRYIQVAASMTEESTFNREIAPLRSIRDNYPKMILTLDKLTPGNYDGIEVRNVIDWLLTPQTLS
ncbi:ATP-binding protein [Synergistes jonesii]|uniref:ATP-binding protein n=1 Tax=Synergistes jonesii TaxID=2754 RepID=UPI00248E18CC|nr:ATP-binding protein [Synergistes jonesii]